MKLTKRLAAIAACAVMATSSMMSMGVYATEAPTDTSITMSLEDFMSSPYLRSRYEGIYYCTTDGSAYINNLGSSGMTFNKVYAFNGYKVHATTTTGYIGPNSQTAAEGYGCYVDLTSGSYSYLVGNNWSTSAIGDTSIRGYVNLRNPGERDQYAIIDIVDSRHNIKQTFVQEINN
ncbi:MAG: hypothetical protein K2I06_11260 [Ruminococcus sp.]|nr:hypothetical protein [Ruminococcus sp.]